MMNTSKTGLRLLFFWLVLLTVGAVAQKPENEDGKEAALSGRFGILWVDSRQGHEHAPMYFLQPEAGGKPIFLTLDEAKLTTFGGPHALIGKNVEIRGVWKSAANRQFLMDKLERGSPETVEHAPVRTGSAGVFGSQALGDDSGAIQRFARCDAAAQIVL
jgi:hypothetical protein